MFIILLILFYMISIMPMNELVMVPNYVNVYGVGHSAISSINIENQLYSKVRLMHNALQEIRQNEMIFSSFCREMPHGHDTIKDIRTSIKKIIHSFLLSEVSMMFIKYYCCTNIDLEEDSLDTLCRKLHATGHLTFKQAACYIEHLLKFVLEVKSFNAMVHQLTISDHKDVVSSATNAIIQASHAFLQRPNEKRYQILAGFFHNKYVFIRRI